MSDLVCFCQMLARAVDQAVAHAQLQPNAAAMVPLVAMVILAYALDVEPSHVGSV